MSQLIVVLPVCQKDIACMRKNLEWQIELGGCRGYKAVLALDRSMSDAQVGDLLMLARKCYDFVWRFDYPRPKVEYWPYGPNFAWQQTAIFMRSLKTPWLWLEADAIPLKAGWLDALCKEYLRGCRPFMGVVVPGYGHCNGVAIYPATASQLCPRAMAATSQAWDVAMAPEMMPYCHNAAHLIQHVWGRVNGEFHPHIGDAPSFPEGWGLNEISPTAVILHRCKDGTLIDRLREPNKPRLMALTAPASQPKMAIFIRTYRNDAQWLVYCLRSINKFCSGYSETVVVCPVSDHTIIAPLVKYPNMRVDVTEDEPERGYVLQQVTKMKADMYTNADYVLYTDSDCVFTKPNSPSTWFNAGKIVYLITPWAQLADSGAMKWKAITEAALGFEVQEEVMRRLPLVYPRSVISACRAWVESLHKMSLREYVLAQPEFSEFNVMGNFALHQKPQQFDFWDTTNRELPETIVSQKWSYGGITPQIQQETEALLR